MKHLYFVRHAEPDHSWKDDRTRPLSPAGLSDRGEVTRALHGIAIDRFVSSPYKRTMDTIRESADEHSLQIVTDERLRERQCGVIPNTREMLHKRWQDFDFHEVGGESLRTTQRRNIEAVHELLKTGCDSEAIVVGTHGTALSTILNHFDSAYRFENYWRMIDFMPYIIRLDFEGAVCIGREEILIVEKPYDVHGMP